ncbi:MAG: MaoC/PaaZ C-terminal domain-containing protein [Actinomycetota bacterium]
MTELCNIKYAEVEVGQEIPAFSHKFDRMDAIMYAGAGGDFNPIHVNPFFAKDVAMLPDVIAHGLFQMALLGKTVMDWIGDPGYLKKLSCQFRGMTIPEETVNFKGKVREKLEDNLVVLDVWAEKDDGTVVLKGGEATVYLP